MVIDGHIHLSKARTTVWNHPPFTAEMLLDLMRGPFPLFGRPYVVDRAVVQPHSGETLDFTRTFAEQHSYISEVIEAHPGRLIGCMHINPHLGVPLAIDQLNKFVKDGRYRAVKLNPSLHAYMPPRCRDLLDPIFEAAGSLRVPVIVHTGDPPFSLPVLLAPYARAHPHTTIILGHLGTQKVSYADEAIYVAQQHENVLLETGWGTLPRLKEAVQALGAERLVFASDCPIQEIGSQLRPLEVMTWASPMGIGLSESDAMKIMGDNMEALLTRAGPLE